MGLALYKRYTLIITYEIRFIKTIINYIHNLELVEIFDA